MSGLKAELVYTLMNGSQRWRAIGGFYSIALDKIRSDSIRLAVPALAAKTNFVFMGAWNGFLKPLMFMSDKSMFTMIGKCFEILTLMSYTTVRRIIAFGDVERRIKGTAGIGAQAWYRARGYFFTIPSFR
ncbi:hypothetical protein [Paenibacillus sp. LHD-38]|uniref:hypothetical protein n=1 Tax=Paenibacillus sp. LHD-38 TaxID=3072143 RepID=UPI00280E00A0|nr:hypothetical protein [Paenibacillus sp. LHD-38]MDQ8738718.1 hypothetical protein [Paenibacillus sp. LHD-38]